MAALGPSCDEWASHCGAFFFFPVVKHGLSGMWASVVAAHRLSVGVHGLSCSWDGDLLRPGIKPISSVLAGEFLINGPSGKPPFNICFMYLGATTFGAHILTIVTSSWIDP